MDVLGGFWIPATPFDHKMDLAGALYFQPTSPIESIVSIEELFMRAKSIRYVPDPPGEDYWQTPQETQARWAGDCEDKAIWLFAELKKNGYHDLRLVIGRYRSVDKKFHVWLTRIDDENNVLILDPTTQKKIWKASDFEKGFYQPLYSFDGINRYRHEPATR